MTDFINKFKIPTILGLGIIFLGLIGGLYLVLRPQTFLSQATPDLTPQNITITNISDNSAVISWQTNSNAASFISFGQQNPREQTVLDDRDSNPPAGGPKPHLTHYVTLKNLLPQTHYQFKITSGKATSDILKFDTAKPLTSQTGFTPIIGSVLLNDSTPLNDGIAYLSISGAVSQSALIKSGGNFLIPLSQIVKENLTDAYQLTEGAVGKIVIISDKGTASLLFNLKSNSTPLPPVKLGQNIDLTTPEETPQPVVNDLEKYDLNNDGKINTTDYSLASSCFGKKPAATLAGGKTCAKADINGDGKIDQKDLDLMSQKLKTLGSQ